MVSHVEHFFMCLLFIFMYSWGKHLGFPPNFNQRNQGNNPFTITSKRIKCLRISLSKGSKILYLENYKTLKKEIEAYKAKEAAGAVDQLLAGAATGGSVKVLTVKLPGADAGKLRQMGDVLKDKDASVVAVLASAGEDKVTFLAVCGKDAVKAGVKAGDIVRNVCAVCGGKGGGKPDSAMGGGKDASKMDEALNSVAAFVGTLVK